MHGNSWLFSQVLIWKFDDHLPGSNAMHVSNTTSLMWCWCEVEGDPSLSQITKPRASGLHFQGVLAHVIPVWDDIFTPTLSSPRGENIVTIFSPPLRYFHPLTISNGKSFGSQISLNFIMCIYNKEPFFILSMNFYRFLSITDCWYNPLTCPPKHWVSTAKRVSCLNIITSTSQVSWGEYMDMNNKTLVSLQSQIWKVKIFKYNHLQCQILG